MLPESRGAVLGDALTRLTPDDGPQLADILQQLRGEVAREPANLHASTALVYALALAGLVEEARPLAWRAFEQMRRLPSIGRDTFINVGAGLSEGGWVDEAKGCYEQALSRGPSEGLLRSIACLAVRFGELPWLERLVPEHPIPAFLQRHQLVDGWAAQQVAIESALTPHVSTFDAKLVDFRDGTERLVVDYFTDTADLTRIAAMEEAVWGAVERHHETHPSGPGVLLGIVVLNVHGCEIPLP